MAKAPRKTAEFVDTAGNEIDTINPNVVTLDKPIKRAGQTIDKVTLIEPNAGTLRGVSLAAVNFVKILLVDRMIMGNPYITLAVDLVVCLTLVVTVFISKFVGCTLPMLAQKAGFDPAVMASPFLTTIVDAISLLVYFSVAKAILHI